MRIEQEIMERVKERYTRAVAAACCEACSCAPDYSPEELALVPSEAILGLGSGNPVRYAHPQEGEVVVDLGSGAGVDVFLAAARVGPEGKSIGIDMTPAMVHRAREVAARSKLANVEFHQGLIEALPLPDGAADAVVSNCVINLSPDKARVFSESFRVLRPGGRLVVSDIVQERPLGEVEADCGCVSTAMVRGEYLETIRAAGFTDVEVLEDRPWQTGPGGVEASSITVRGWKLRHVL